MLILSIIEWCMIYEKLNHRWWEYLIPFYGTYQLYKELYGNGWIFLLELIPIYGLYIFIKTRFMLAEAFDKTAVFGLGLFFLPVIFNGILSFSDKAEYCNEPDCDCICKPALILTIIPILLITLFYILVSMLIGF